MTNSEPNPERVQEDARLAYGLYGSAINYLKSQQWTATYYVLVIYGAILGYASLFGHFESAAPGATGPITRLRCWEVTALIAIAAVSGFVGIYYLWQSNRFIARYRGDNAAFANPRNSDLSPDHKISRPIGDVLFRCETDTPSRGEPLLYWAGASIIVAWMMMSYALIRPFIS